MPHFKGIACNDFNYSALGFFSAVVICMQRDRNGIIKVIIPVLVNYIFYFFSDRELFYELDEKKIEDEIRKYSCNDEYDQIKKELTDLVQNLKNI